MNRTLPLLLLVSAGLLTYATAGTAGSPAKETFVIVHGATAGGWEWKKVGEFLAADGHTVYRPTLTGLGERVHLSSTDIDLETHIKDVVNTILFEDLHDIILCGHSYGGMVITGVMDRLPDRIKHVVFLDAAVPDDSESLWSMFGREGPRDSSRFVDGMMTTPWVKPDTKPPHNTPQSIKCFNQPVSYKNPEAKALQVTYVAFVPADQSAEERAGRDKSWQRAVARGWTIRTYPGHHVAQMETPRGVATLIEESVNDRNQPVVGATGTVEPDPNFHVFLCIGQSNMEGYPGIPEEERTYSNERFQVLAAVDFPKLGRETGNWYPAVPPLCRPNSGMSPADYFGRTLAANMPESIKVGVVNVSVAGARIEVYDEEKVDAYTASAPEWMRGIIAAYGGSPYRRLVDMARIAQRDGVIKGILLQQGEANTGDAEWPAQVQRLYERLLADLGLEAADVPLLAGEVVGADQNGLCASMNDIIATLPSVIPTAHVVSSEGCPAHPDRLHFTPEGYKILGTRHAETMLPLLIRTAPR